MPPSKQIIVVAEEIDILKLDHQVKKLKEDLGYLQDKVWKTNYITSPEP